MKELASKRFRDWLEQRSPYGSIGVAGTIAGCPLATYLGPGWRVRASTARYVEPGPWGCGVPASGAGGPEVRVVGLPVWARRFVAAVDALPEREGRPRRVWPRTALELLDEIERGITLERQVAHRLWRTVSDG